MVNVVSDTISVIIFAFYFYGNFCLTLLFLQGFVWQQDHWEEKGQFGLFKEDTFDWKGLEDFLERNSSSFWDFDNHLDDSSRDWFNRNLGKKTKK